MVTWGTSPEMVVPVDACVPDPERETDGAKRRGMQHALAHMRLMPGTPMTEIWLDLIFIGSCTTSRISDLRIAAAIVRGKKVAPSIDRRSWSRAPNSSSVRPKRRIGRGVQGGRIRVAGAGVFDVLRVNEDRLDAGERCASTFNRNFEGRQRAGGLTHLVSPAMAAAAASRVTS